MSELNGKKLLKLLSRIHLGGSIEECVLKFKKNAATIQAVDMTNTIFISCQEKIFQKDGTLGLGNLTILTKYLESMTADKCGTTAEEDKEKVDDNLEMKISKNRLHLSRRNSGKFMYLLTDADLVPTAVPSDKVNFKKFLKIKGAKFDITKEFIKEYLYYVGLIKPKSVTLSVSKNGELILTGGLSSSHQFKIKGPKGKKSKDSIHVNTAFLTPILNALEITKKKTPALRFGDESPLVITQDDNNIWAILALSKEEDE